MSTLDDVERLLRSHRFRAASEGELQDLVAQLLGEAFPADAIEREVTLRPESEILGKTLGRIDFRIACPVVYAHGCSAAHDPGLACEHGAVCFNCAPFESIEEQTGIPLPAVTCETEAWIRPFVGLELKFPGVSSRAKALRQCSAYMLSDGIASLIVAAPAATVVAGWPRELAGKPCRAIHLRSYL